MALASTVAGCMAGDRASSGECPSGETCSDQTPDGLYFRGTAVAGLLFGDSSGPAITAIGGVQTVTIEDGDGNPFALPFDATAGGAVEISAVSGAEITIEGVETGQTYLRIAEPGSVLLYDRKAVNAQRLDRVELAPATLELRDVDTGVAFAAGDPAVAIALFGPPDVDNYSSRLVDTSMQVDPAGGDRTAWDTVVIPGAVPGIYPIAVTAAGLPTVTLEAEVVAGPESIAPFSDTPAQLVVNTGAYICFSPLAGGKHVLGLEWTFTLNGQDLVPFANCATFTPDATGPLTLDASAGGVSTRITIEVVPASPGTRTLRPRPRWSPVGAGDRAQ